MKTVTDFMKMLSGLGHPSFKSLAAYKNNKNVTDSFSKFFFPSKGPTEDIIPGRNVMFENKLSQVEVIIHVILLHRKSSGG